MGHRSHKALLQRENDRPTHEIPTGRHQAELTGRGLMSILKNSPTGSGLWSSGNDVHHRDAAPASASLSCASVSSAAISSATAMGSKLGRSFIAGLTWSGGIRGGICWAPDHRAQPTNHTFSASCAEQFGRILCAIRPVGDMDVALFDRSARQTERHCGFSDGAVNHLLGLSGRHALAAMFLAHSACQRATSKAALPMGQPSSFNQLPCDSRSLRRSRPAPRCRPMPCRCLSAITISAIAISGVPMD